MHVELPLEPWDFGIVVDNKKLLFYDFCSLLRSLSFIGSSGRLVQRISKVSSKSEVKSDWTLFVFEMV